jgi:hypothetical protein
LFLDRAEQFWFRASRGRYRGKRKQSPHLIHIGAVERSGSLQIEISSKKVRTVAGQSI